jgi:hypothetical protein
MQLNEDLMKSLNGAIDAAVKQLVDIEQLAKSDVSLQDAKLRPETANGTLPGDNREESALKPEDAKKAEDAAAKGENPFADKDKDGKDDKGEAKEGKKDEKKDSKKESDDDGDMDDDKAEKMKAKIKKYEDDKAAKAAAISTPMTKSEAPTVDAEALTKSIVATVSQEMAKSFSARIEQLEALVKQVATAPAARTSVSGLAPLAKSAEDVGQPAQPVPNKGQVLDQLFTMQQGGDKRVDSGVIARIEMGDFSALAERGINLK